MICSVIVTAYNQEATISQTLDSILEQKCNFPFEIIIGDDCSMDGTQTICLDYKKKYPEIIRLLFQEQNVGVAINFVLSVKEAKGKYIAICAADDFWHNKSKLQMQVDFMEKNAAFGLLYTDYNKLNAINGKIIKNFLKTSHLPIYEGAGLVKYFFNGQVPALTLTIIFHKDLFDKYVPSNDYIKYKFPIEDWPTWLILSKYTKIGYLSESTATYRFGHESMSIPTSYTKTIERFNREKTMYKYLCNMFPEEISFDENEYDQYVNSILLSLSYKKGDYKNAHKYGKQMIYNGSKNLKVDSSKYILSFYLLWLSIKIKSGLTNYKSKIGLSIILGLITIF